MVLIAPASGFFSLGFLIPRAPLAPCGIIALRLKKPARVVFGKPFRGPENLSHYLVLRIEICYRFRERK